MTTTKICECCGHSPDDCICPECPTCQQVGNPSCYRVHATDALGHGLRYTAYQLLGQARYRLGELDQMVRDQYEYIDYLLDQICQEDNLRNREDARLIDHLATGVPDAF